MPIQSIGSWLGGAITAVDGEEVPRWIGKSITVPKPQSTERMQMIRDEASILLQCRSSSTPSLRNCPLLSSYEAARVADKIQAFEQTYQLWLEPLRTKVAQWEQAHRAWTVKWAGRILEERTLCRNRDTCEREMLEFMWMEQQMIALTRPLLQPYRWLQHQLRWYGDSLVKSWLETRYGITFDVAVLIGLYYD